MFIFCIYDNCICVCMRVCKRVSVYVCCIFVSGRVGVRRTGSMLWMNIPTQFTRYLFRLHKKLISDKKLHTT